MPPPASSLLRLDDAQMMAEMLPEAEGVYELRCSVYREYLPRQRRHATDIY